MENFAEVFVFLQKHQLLIYLTLGQDIRLNPAT